MPLFIFYFYWSGRHRLKISKNSGIFSLSPYLIGFHLTKAHAAIFNIHHFIKVHQNFLMNFYFI